MPEKESFDIDGLMVFRSDLTAVDQDGNIVNGVTTPDRYFPSDREPLSGEQIGRYTNTTAYWREHSTYIPLKGDVIIYSDCGSIEQGGVTVYVPKIKVGDGVTSINNLPFTDSDNQGGGTEEVFVCTFAGTSPNISCNKTLQNILDALTARKPVLGILGEKLYSCSFAASNGWVFFFSLNHSNDYADLIWLKTTNGQTWSLETINLQPKLIGSGSGQNIKTINGNNILGSGDLTIGGVTIYSGSTAPSSATGVDGDIYIQEV